MVVTKISKNSQQNSSKTVTNKYDKEILKEIPKERYVYSDERQTIIDDLRLR